MKITAILAIVFGLFTLISAQVYPNITWEDIRMCYLKPPPPRHTLSGFNLGFMQ